MVRLMNIWSTLLAVAVSASIACTGSVEDGTTETPSAAAPATHAAVEQASDDPNDQNEGEDPNFAAAAAGDDAGANDSGAPGGEAPAGGESAPPAAPPADPAATPAVKLLVQEAARQVTAMKVSVYDHTTQVEESTGTYKYDCSGFVGYALSRVLPVQLAALKAFSGGSRPSAMHYEQFFASITPGVVKGGWSRVARAIDARPGDVVAWITPVDLVSSNTGHVMIVTGPATVNPARADEILIPVTDSTSTFHGPSDTRAPKAGTGLGRGSIGIIVDSKGTPVRYRWTGGYSTKEYSTAISFGRPE